MEIKHRVSLKNTKHYSFCKLKIKRTEIRENKYVILSINQVSNHTLTVGGNFYATNIAKKKKKIMIDNRRLLRLDILTKLSQFSG